MKLVEIFLLIFWLGSDVADMQHADEAITFNNSVNSTGQKHIYMAQQGGFCISLATAPV